MEKFRDFLYNKNDILVALLILAIAAAVIVFRLDAIMEYPKILAEQQMQTVEENTANEAQDTTDKDSEKATNSSDEDSEKAKDQTDNSSDKSSNNSDKSSEKASSKGDKN